MKHKLVLKRVRETFIEELEVAPIINALLAQMTISQEEFNRIAAGKTREKKVKSLLDLTPKKCEHMFNNLSNLLGVHQDWLREKLSTEIENVTEGNYSYLNVA